jgi:hypothetical protein
MKNQIVSCLMSRNYPLNYLRVQPIEDLSLECTVAVQQFHKNSLYR